MRLDVDLAFDAVPGRGLGPGEARVLDLHTLAGSARSPRQLLGLLRDCPYDEIRIGTGTLPLSAVQGVLLVVLTLARGRSWVLDGRRLGRFAFLARALARAAVAVPAELAHIGWLARTVTRYTRRRYRLPAHAAAPRRALYLRVDPSMRWLGAQVGGAATHTSGVINGLIENGLDVEVLAAERPAGTDRATFVPATVGRVPHLVRGFAYTEQSAAVLKAARGHGGDFVYQRYQLGGYAGLELARRLGVPLVLEFNGSEIWVERHWGSGGMRFSRSLEALERRNLLDASLIVVVSSPLRDFVLAQGVAAERVVVAPNGVDAARLAPYRVDAPEVWRERAGLPQAPTVGFIGTFGQWHGAALLPELVEKVPAARFVLVGDGGLLPQVREEIRSRGVADRVQLTGLLERDQALRMLAACDVCVSPHVPNPDGTQFFGSPTKLFEYMGLGKPIVASDLDQIGEVIDHERNGLLVAPGDIPAAAAAVQRLLGDDALRERLAEAALQDALTTFSWDAHVRRILDALAGVTSSSGGSAMAMSTGRRP
jgi:glycosyltransferase involved in cell wall biosynthesis